MSVSIKKEFPSFQSQEVIELKRAFATVLADFTAQKVVTDALVTDMATRISDHNTLIAKMNLDAGITDADYAAATAITAVVADLNLVE